LKFRDWCYCIFGVLPCSSLAQTLIRQLPDLPDRLLRPRMMGKRPGHKATFQFAYFVSISFVCVETTPTDSNCVPQWVRVNDTHDIYGTLQARATTIAECQQACEFDPRCVAVYFWSSTKSTLCYLTTDPSYSYVETKVSHHRDLNLCSNTSGQCLDKNSPRV